MKKIDKKKEKPCYDLFFMHILEKHKFETRPVLWKKLTKKKEKPCYDLFFTHILEKHKFETRPVLWKKLTKKRDLSTAYTWMRWQIYGTEA